AGAVSPPSHIAQLALRAFATPPLTCVRGEAELSSDLLQRAAEEAQRVVVQVVAGELGGLAGAGAGVGAFQDAADLVAGQHLVPVGAAHIAAGDRRIVVDQLGSRRKAAPGLYRAGVRPVRRPAG